MKAVVQRVTRASVTIDNCLFSEIGKGLLVLLGVEKNDTPKEAEFLADKIIHLRIFEDAQGKMNISLKDVQGELLVVSQFTLLGDCRKGRRPSYINAAPPDLANALYEHFIAQATALGTTPKTGKFQAMMDIRLINSGPVTLLLDTRHES